MKAFLQPTTAMLPRPRALTSLYVAMMIPSLSGGCSAPTAIDPGAPPASSSPQADFDLIRALDERAGSLEILESFRSRPFGVPGTALRVDGHELQVYEYETPADAHAEADRFSPDGTHFVGPDEASWITWVAPPHLHRRGRWIAVYAGSDAGMMGLLEELMGPQFAGA